MKPTRRRGLEWVAVHAFAIAAALFFMLPFVFVALTAVMRKILITANAVARDRQPWRGRPAAGTPCRPHAEQTARRAGRVKAAAAPRAVARSASLEAA